MKYLLLFDIDGTLLTIPKKGMQVVAASIQELFDCEINLPHKSFSGQTDWQIFRETLHHHDMDISVSGNLWNQFKEIYFSKFEELISKHDVAVHSGADEIITELSMDRNIKLGLLTGNIKKTAYRKLNFIGADHHFEDGAFGDDHWKREWLGTIALHRLGSANDCKTIIIGDTPRDIDVAKYINAVSVGVTNGKYNQSELYDYGADFVIDDLRKFQSILNQIKS